MERVTEARLSAVVARINRLTNSPADAYTRDGDNYTANVGNFHLDHAYGGVSLYRMSNTSGGVSDVFQIGHVSKRELLGAMFAFIRGIEMAPATVAAEREAQIAAAHFDKND